MFIDFEGIDGSGKTTLSNAVAARLRKLGYRVAHAREGGTLQAPAARRIRELTRDAKLLELSARAEFFLNLARDAQQLEEVIKPALARGEVCISDRYVYSQLALSGGGRGLPLPSLDPAVELACQGVRPDLVVLVDVDPDLARMRKRLGKLGQPKTDGDSRKGLAGAGLAVRVREAFLQMAHRDPHRWLIVENNDQPLWILEQRIVEAILARLEGREPQVQPVQPASRRAVVADSRTVEQKFHQVLDEVEVREPKLCAYLLSGIPGPLAHKRRMAYVEKYPALVARGLIGLSDEPSWTLREHLRDQAPMEVLASLGSDPSPRAMLIRRALFDRFPVEVLGGLKHNDSPEAWGLRERAWELNTVEAVLVGLAGLDDERAWELREAAAANGHTLAVARSLAGLAHARADAMRRQLVADDRIAVLRSTTGLDTPFARELRTALFDRATKVVLRSLTGVDAPYAWALRVRGAPLTKEALDSVDGMNTPEAWALRERWASRWACTALSSLRPLPLDDRARELIDRVLSEQPGRLPVLRAAYATVAVATHPQPVRAGASGTRSQASELFAEAG